MAALTKHSDQELAALLKTGDRGLRSPRSIRAIKGCAEAPAFEAGLFVYLFLSIHYIGQVYTKQVTEPAGYMEPK